LQGFVVCLTVRKNFESVTKGFVSHLHRCAGAREFFARATKCKLESLRFYCKWLNVNVYRPATALPYVR